MRAAIAMFALGVWAFQQLPTLPSVTWLAGGSVALTAAACAAVCLCRRSDARAGFLLVCLSAAMAGVLWAGWRAEWRLADELPMQFEGRDVALTGVIAGLPRRLDDGVRFVFQVEEAAVPVPRRLQLSWYGPRGTDVAPPVPRVGERWQLTVRLKRPHGFVNPHGFDYEAWLLMRGLRATGYVRAAADNRRLAEWAGGPLAAVHRARAAIGERFAAVLGDAPQAGIVTALVTGEQHAITPVQWEVFRRTGVTHLMVISGGHVSLVALLVGGLAALAWRRIPALALRLPARRAAALAGLLAAAGYALLAGMEIPVQRALIMLAVVALALLTGREAAASRVLALALLAVLVADPWVVLAAGFWLSFAAVGVIVLVLGGRLAIPSAWRAAVRVQLAITLALVPALLLLFQSFSLLSPLANALAIPLVSFVLTPLALAAALLPVDALLHLAAWFAGWLLVGLEWLASSPLTVWRQAAPPGWLVAAGAAAVGWLLLPRGTPARGAALLALVPLLGWSPPRPAPGGFVATVLDVGQGQAIHVQTAGRDLLLDAGPPYGPAADAGERVVLPYLLASGVGRLDRLVVSHGDSDHAGGAASVLAGIEVAALAGSLAPGHGLPERAGRALHACRAGEHWEWDGVRFEVLHPAADGARLRKENDNACVLRIAAAGGAVLVASDVERVAEQALLARAGEGLASHVIVAPHHGSRTSSTPALVAAVRPQAVVYSVGYRNAFGHPHADVWARWAAAGAQAWRTDSQGAIRVAVGVDGVSITAERERRPRYWHGR
ncbi:DNA internalization-related competence protein ComEC/Rec2 [Pseudothauera rhizosphaerae]|uniref:DNA internalization-related competence protein ComEC/Rec2 n=1 Tax=Pseudothauera rhizosphaerae TaxID=2565932 RepID=A0A4S4AMS7_9RHOO|nr:DNA internalization-related competence protein ComEC/Rec2 [Pseudothauera rhizosphaerae]THF60828.1 DNA internalization-related competence protein ComEC/Rec2 [Pseudothauera rhizosphaerae]